MVERLILYLPMMHTVIYHENQNLTNMLNRSNIDKTMFTKWMEMNKVCEDVRVLSYAEFPTK